MESKYNFCILGAGIAGLSLADALHERGYSVILVEKYDIGSGASGTPGGLVNPATGRRATKTWKAEDCYNAINLNLEKVQAVTEVPFFRNNGLLRPAVTQKMVRKMRNQYEKTPWPDGWCYWLSAKKIKEKHPGITCIDGGLWLPIGLTVDIGAYLQAYANYLRANGVTIQTQCEATAEPNETNWQITDGESEFSAVHLVHTIGYASTSHTWWNHLPLEGVKGQIAIFRADKNLLSFDHSISSLGYLARFKTDNTFIQGSTYNHDFDDTEPDNGGEQYLRKRLARTLPELAEKAELIDQWAGVRVTTPDKKPILGRHPEIKNLHLFTALGSKGLMYGKFLAEHYADHLKNGTAIFKKVSIERFD
ncbi:MAG: FAD-binding oxidoreductase [Balneolaceae bacterium]|nr:FAD-binding oxidoreductase [Balneolaceae bacterium]